MNYYLSFFLIISTFVVNPIYTQDVKECFICQGHTHGIKERPYKDFTFKSELPFIASTAGLVLTSQLLNSPSPLSIEEINRLDKNNVNSFDRYAISKNSSSAQNASDFLLTGVLVLPAIFLSNHHTRKDLIPLIVMPLEAILINFSLTEISKKLVKRTRPLAYNPNFSLEEKLEDNTRVSFFSGHTSHTATLSFLIAKVMTDYHPATNKGFKIGIWSFAALVPATTGYLRIRAGKHFPTDTIAGFIAGGLVGVLVPHFHKKRKINKKIKLQSSLSFNAASLRMHF